MPGQGYKLIQLIEDFAHDLIGRTPLRGVQHFGRKIRCSRHSNHVENVSYEEALYSMDDSGHELKAFAPWDISAHWRPCSKPTGKKERERRKSSFNRRQIPPEGLRSIWAVSIRCRSLTRTSQKMSWLSGLSKGMMKHLVSCQCATINRFADTSSV